jgi:hypothetical protein
VRSICDRQVFAGKHRKATMTRQRSAPLVQTRWRARCLNGRPRLQKTRCAICRHRSENWPSPTIFRHESQAPDREARRGTIERTQSRRPVAAQRRLLSIPRLSFCDAPQGETAMTLDLMLLADKQFLDTPFDGVRQMT